MTTLHTARPRTWTDDNGRAGRRCSSLSGSPCFIEPDHSLRQHFTRLRSNSDSVPMLPVRRPDIQATTWRLKTDEQSNLPGTVGSEYDRWSSGSKAGSCEMNSSPVCSSTQAGDLRRHTSYDTQLQANVSKPEDEWSPSVDPRQPNASYPRGDCEGFEAPVPQTCGGSLTAFSNTDEARRSRVHKPCDFDAVDYWYESLDPQLELSSPSIVLCPAPPKARCHRRRVSITSSPDGTTIVSVEEPPASSSRPSHRRMSLTAGQNGTQVLTIEDGDDPDPHHDASSSSSVSAMSDGDGSGRSITSSHRRREAGAASHPKARQPRRWSLSLSVPRSSKLTVEFTEPES
jgi:hypothetical protein